MTSTLKIGLFSLLNQLIDYPIIYFYNKIENQNLEDIYSGQIQGGPGLMYAQKPRCSDAQIPRCPKAQMPRSPDAQMPRNPDAQMPRCPESQMHINPGPPCIFQIFRSLVRRGCKSRPWLA